MQLRLTTMPSDQIAIVQEERFELRDGMLIIQVPGETMYYNLAIVEWFKV